MEIRRLNYEARIVPTLRIIQHLRLKNQEFSKQRNHFRREIHRRLMNIKNQGEGKVCR